MNGLEIAEVKLSDLDLGDRLDAEYFSKENLLISKRLHEKQTRTLGEIGKFAVSAFYPAATHLYAEGDVAFMRCVDCINYPVISRMQDETFERIPSSFLAAHGTIDTVGKGDIIITKVGSPCYASIVHEHEEVALSRTVLGLKNISGINPYYLLAFLRSHYGFNQLLRQRELTIQYQLTVERVRAVDVFIPTVDFQTRIEKLVKAAHEKLEQSKRLYAEAESLLLGELGLRDWQPTNENVAVKSFKESFAASGRLDAEFYQPTDLELEQRLTSLPLGFNFIEDIVDSMVNGVESREFVEDGVPYIRVGDLRHLEIDADKPQRIPQSEADALRSKVELEVGDVLTVRSGSIGQAAIVKSKDLKSVISSHLIRLRLKKDSPIKSTYLTVFLNTMPGIRQVLRHSNGGIVPEISQPNLKKIIVPIVALETQQEIERIINISNEMRDESKRLLELAKRGVESAIEQDEQAALELIGEKASNL